MMTDYIKRAEAMADFEACDAENPNWTPTRVKTLLNLQPAADVAEVVRCASYKYVTPTVNAHTGEQVGIWCCLHDILNVSPDDYCSRGEKKGATE